MNKKILVSLVAFSICLSSFAQAKYFMSGVPKDDGTYDRLPRRKEMATKGSSLPSSYSLVPYCPKAGDQGYYGTCTCWAAVYAARTIAEAVNHGWTDKEHVTDEAFSPIYIYAKTKKQSDSNCQKGVHISDALEALKCNGSPKLDSFDPKCAMPDELVGRTDLANEAGKYKIENYHTLFSIRCNDKNLKTSMVRKAISEKRPVVIAMWLDEASFNKTKDLLDLQGVSGNFPTKNDDIEGYHAMCVVGYDDNRYGGAFQILNSWGADWGEKGFFWAKYEDFARSVDQAFDFYVAPTAKPLPEPEPKPEPKPKPKPKPQPKPVLHFDGSFEMWHIKTPDNKPTFASLPMDVSFLPKANASCYQLKGGVRTGDQLRLYLDNHEPAYVYVITSDDQNNVDIMFPFDNYSPALTYKSNLIALPDEDHTMKIETIKGTNYWLLLYSKEELNINDIKAKLEKANGNFYDKVKHTLGDKMVPNEDLRFVENRIEFSARSEKSVVAVFIEAKHR